jgi:hypothetical protein
MKRNASCRIEQSRPSLSQFFLASHVSRMTHQREAAGGVVAPAPVVSMPVVPALPVSGRVVFARVVSALVALPTGVERIEAPPIGAGLIEAPM